MNNFTPDEMMTVAAARALSSNDVCFVDVAPDPLGSQYLGLAQRPVGGRRLQGAVAAGASGEVLGRGRGANGDDGAAPVGQGLGGRLDPRHQGLEVDVEVVDPAVEVTLGLGRGVVHEHIDAAQGLARRGHPGSDGVGVGGVDGLTDHGPAVGQIGQRLFDAVG